MIAVNLYTRSLFLAIYIIGGSTDLYICIRASTILSSYLLHADDNITSFCSQYGIYQTVFRRSGPNSAGLPTCRIRAKDQEIRDVRVIGISNPVMVIFSPGFRLEPQEE